MSKICWILEFLVQMKYEDNRIIVETLSYATGLSWNPHWIYTLGVRLQNKCVYFLVYFNYLTDFFNCTSQTTKHIYSSSKTRTPNECLLDVTTVLQAILESRNAAKFGSYEEICFVILFPRKLCVGKLVCTTKKSWQVCAQIRKYKWISPTSNRSAW